MHQFYFQLASRIAKDASIFSARRKFKGFTKSDASILLYAFARSLRSQFGMRHAPA
jgi:hypothetical protein